MSTLWYVTSNPQLAKSLVAFCVLDENGQTLFASPLAETALCPASAAALGVLGPEFRFETTLLATAPLDHNGRLTGNLVLMGGGDPNFFTRRIGTRNETFAREMMEFARQRPDLRPGGIDFAAIERDLAARDQITPMLLELKALVRIMEDTHTALGVDLFNGTRGMYMAMKPIAEINGVQDVMDHIGQRFAGQGRRKKTPDTVSLDSSSL